MIGKRYGGISFLAFCLVTTLFIATATSGKKENQLTAISELQSKVEALETKISKKGFVFIPPTAFGPDSQGQGYGTARVIPNDPVFRGGGPFYVNVRVPHGAIITNLTAYLHDNLAGYSISVWLLGFNFTLGQHLYYPMAEVETIGTPSNTMLYDDTINDARIDNKNCIYSLKVYFAAHSNELGFKGAWIEYEYQAR